MLKNQWNELWVTVFVILVVIGTLGGQGIVIGFGVMGLLVSGVSWVWNKVSLEEVEYERDLSSQRVFIGEEVSMTITLTNRKPVPLARVELEDEIPGGIEIADADLGTGANPDSHVLRHSTSVAAYERIAWRYSIKGLERGYYRIGPVRMASGDLFGFFDGERTSTQQDYLLVYPRVVPLEEMGFPASRPLGEVTGGIRIFQDLSRPSGIREYKRGDPLKIVDWKATAKAQQLQVRTFESSSNMTVVLVVVVETTARYWEGYSPVNLERVITAAASVASYAAERQYNLGLFSNGTPILTDRPMKMPPNRSPGQLTAVLEALATMHPLTYGPMSEHLADHARRFPLGATLVVITSFLSQELVEATGDLKAQGYTMVVVYVGDHPPPELPSGVLVYELREHFARMEMASEFGPG